MRRVSLTAEAARQIAERAATRLAADPRVQLVYLFGSAADPTRHTVRDVDLAVLTSSPLTLDDLMRVRADLVATAGGHLDLISLNAWVAERGLQLGAEAIFAIGNHVLSAHFGVSPKDYEDIIVQLAACGVIDDAVRQRLKGLGGFRNILVHGYLRIDPDRVAEVPKDEMDLIRPAVDDTRRVLSACAESGTVKRVVLTSSVAAIAFGHDAQDRKVRTETDWSNVDRCEAYRKSKTLAERAAWEFVNGLPAGSRFELAVINPGFVLGPALNADPGTSGEVVRKLLVREMPACPRIGFALVDVRDIAIAHRLAMERPEAAGNRYVCAGDHMWIEDMAKVLAAEFNPKGYKVPTGRYRSTCSINRIASATPSSLRSCAPTSTARRCSPVSATHGATAAVRGAVPACRLECHAHDPEPDHQRQRRDRATEYERDQGDLRLVVFVHRTPPLLLGDLSLKRVRSSRRAHATHSTTRLCAPRQRATWSGRWQWLHTCPWSRDTRSTRHVCRPTRRRTCSLARAQSRT